MIKLTTNHWNISLLQTTILKCFDITSLPNLLVGQSISLSCDSSINNTCYVDLKVSK